MLNKPFARLLLLLCIVVAILTGCAGATPEPQSHWPTEGWPTSTPEEQGMDSVMLADMLETIEEQDYDIDSVVVVRNGYMVVDATIFPFELGSRHIIYSCTKSVVSALVGIAIDKSYIEGVDQPVLGFFPERTAANLDSQKEAVTLERVLTMSIGLKCQDSYLYRWKTSSSQRPNQPRHCPTIPMVWCCSNPASKPWPIHKNR